MCCLSFSTTITSERHRERLHRFAPADLDTAQDYSQLRHSGHMYPVQRKLFSTLFWEKESGKKGVFNAVQIMKNVSGKNLFRITRVAHWTSQ